MIVTVPVDTVMNVHIKTMTEDDDKEVVAQACTNVADIFKDFGYQAVEPCTCIFDLASLNPLFDKVSN